MIRPVFIVLLSSLAAGQMVQASPPSDRKTVVVSGATGRTGLLLYKRLKAAGVWNVRAFVRNTTKAKDILGCTACNESEGIFVGDITDPSSLVGVMKGADSLVITTASEPHCTGVFPFLKCSFSKGAMPKDIDWKGTKSQLLAFASSGGSVQSKQVLYVSTMGTTSPDNFLDKFGNGFTSFYHLQAESFVMSAGIPFTIVKPCGLGDGPPGKNKLIVGHDDASFSMILDHTIQRDDVARILVEAVRNPTLSAGLRFDVCSQFWGSPTTDIAHDVLKAARLPWDHRDGVAKLIV